MRGKASFANRLQGVLLLLVVARTAAARGVIYVDADAPGANNSTSRENSYVFYRIPAISRLSCVRHYECR